MNEKLQYQRGFAECGIEYFEYIVSERVQVNPDNSRGRSAMSQPKPWCNDIGVLNLYHGYCTTILSSQPSDRWYKSTNQKIGIRIAYAR